MGLWFYCARINKHRLQGDKFELLGYNLLQYTGCIPKMYTHFFPPDSSIDVYFF